jgi:HNH endonuclease
MDLTPLVLVIDDTPQTRGFSRRCSRRAIQGRPRASRVTSPLAHHPDHSRLNLHLRTDGHHIIHWSDGGPTELENLVLLCLVALG